MSVLEATLSKLSRYDEGSLIGSILSFTVKYYLLLEGSFFLLSHLSYCRTCRARARTWARATLTSHGTVWTRSEVKWMMNFGFWTSLNNGECEVVCCLGRRCSAGCCFCRYTGQINMLCQWLSERLDHSLHLYQCTCLAHIVKKIYSDFELQGVMEDKLNSKAYQTVSQRMATEEATCALTMGQSETEWVYEICSTARAPCSLLTATPVSTGATAKD